MKVPFTASPRAIPPAVRRRVWGLLLVLIAAIAAPAGGAPAECRSIALCECCCCTSSCPEADRGPATTRCCQIDPSPAMPPPAADAAVLEAPTPPRVEQARVQDTAPEAPARHVAAARDAGSRFDLPATFLLTCSLLL